MLQQPDVTTAVTAGAVTLGGVVTGLDYAVLLAGFAGGLVSLSFLPPMTIWRRIWTPVTATLTAGYTAPLGLHYAHKVIGADANSAPLEMFAAFTTGLVAQFVIPVVIKVVKERAEKKVRKGSSPS